ncbi:MAG: helix-turn-helix domain-containing protein [Bacillus sp. (in: firmicutes)]
MEYIKNYDYPAIGKRIKALRQGQKMSQQALADILDKSLRTVQKYESGEIEVSIAIVNKLARIFESSPTFILGYETNIAPIKTLADVVEFFFKLEQVSDLDFSVDIKKPPHNDEWEGSITFNGKAQQAECNADICLFMERWKEEREDFKAGRQSERSYNLWKDQVVARYASAHLKSNDPTE